MYLERPKVERDQGRLSNTNGDDRLVRPMAGIKMKRTLRRKMLRGRGNTLKIYDKRQLLREGMEERLYAQGSSLISGRR